MTPVLDEFFEYYYWDNIIDRVLKWINYFLKHTACYMLCAFDLSVASLLENNYRPVNLRLSFFLAVSIKTIVLLLFFLTISLPYLLHQDLYIIVPLVKLMERTAIQIHLEVAGLLFHVIVDAFQSPSTFFIQAAIFSP